MFNIFNKSSKPNFVYDQAVIITIPYDESDSVFYKKINDFEKKLSDYLIKDSGIDGHEFGEGECTIYVYGSSADGIWEGIKKFVKGAEFERIDITLQYGQPDDPKTKDKKFTV